MTLRSYQIIIIIIGFFEDGPSFTSYLEYTFPEVDIPFQSEK